jgi:hypothetical protein
MRSKETAPPTPSFPPLLLQAWNTISAVPYDLHAYKYALSFQILIYPSLLLFLYEPENHLL